MHWTDELDDDDFLYLLLFQTRHLQSGEQGGYYWL